ncbi:hypothetical protein [Vulgatibacter sp.]|uniref:DUF7793 family protein n=1 Tax=Vulgatibacter sp. TaxID=1971226 RepID=UPI003569871D
MEKKPDTSGWTPVGSTSKCDCYAVTPWLAVMVPHQGMRDTAESAREQVEWQDAYWARLGHPGCFAIYMDNIVDQDAGARDVYAEETHGSMTLCYALIGSTFWGRAIAAVYTGLKRPPITTRFFATLDDAMPWLESMARAARSTG